MVVHLLKQVAVRSTRCTSSSVFVYARGAEHEYREPCRAVVRLAGQGVLAGEASVELVQEYAHILRVRDAVHAATALRRGISIILSADHDFDDIAGLERLDPHDAVRQLAPGPQAGN